MKLTPTQLNRIKKTVKKYNLNFIVLFGSQTENATHKKSDIDLAYSSKTHFDYKKEYNLSQELQRILNSNIEIDLVNLNNVSPFLAKKIAFEGKLLAENTLHSFAYFQMYAFKLFNEFRPLMSLRDKFIAKNI
ncbi:MAG: nucleotidyltransferase domain-containing protein [bacterium]|nr:nucleotidyltransferase domain-containing protein [bacterium]